MKTSFSEIITGEMDASFVYRDELVSAFMDIEPINPGHVLVVPNQTISSILDLDDETCRRLFSVGRSIARAIQISSIPCDGFNLFLADGEAAGQEVFHVHLHIIPRLHGDGFQLGFPGTGDFKADRKELDQVAQLIGRNLDNTE